MYLSKIVLNGFKSFYTKTSIELDGGITNIVGPNGCGKSNILDAVRWVLGEQSPKQLRGEQISDVISNGNARRASKNSASAFLTFSDCEDWLGKKEIEVGRAVAQDGQGTYFLDGEKVRLRDIKDLFRDTGIGQELYSVIGQGEVQELVKSKPADRREIVEEAAGVATYRHRRDLTKKRLAQTREDLLTVEEELRKNQGRLSQLETQAEKAEQVKEIQRKLRQFQVEQAWRKFIQHRDKLEKIENQIDETTGKYEQLCQRKQKIKDRKDNFQAELSRLEQRFGWMEKQALNSRDGCQKASRDRSSFALLAEELEDQIRGDRARKENYLQQLARIFSDLAGEYEKLYESRLRESIYDQTASLLDKRETALRIQCDELDEQLSELRSNSLFQISEESEYQHWVKSLREEEDNLDSDYRKLSDKIAGVRSRLREGLNICRENLRRYSETETEKVELHRSLRLIDRQVRSLEKLKNEFVRNQEKLERQQEKVNSRRQTLHSLQKNYQGYFDGVREIMSLVNQQAEEGVKGVLANLIEVQPRFQDALGSALGKYNQAIVVRDISTVQELVHHRETEEMGRVNFLCLNRLRQLNFSPPDKELDSYSRVLGPATRFVEYDRGIAPVLEYVLRDFFVVKDFSAGKELLGENGHQANWKAVTPEGEIIASDGVVSTGNFNNNQVNLVGRTRKINRLREKQRTLSERVDKFDRKTVSVSTLLKQLDARRSKVASALRGIQSEAREAYEKLSGSLHRINSQRNNYRSLLLQLAEIEMKKLRNSNARCAAAEISSTIKERDKHRQAQQAEYRNKLQKYERLLEDSQQSWRKVEKKSHTAHSNVQRCRERIDQLTQRRKELSDEISRIQSQNYRRSKKWLNNEKKCTRAKLRELRLKNETEVWREIKSSYNRLRNSRQDQLEEINSRLQEKENLVGKKETRLDNLKHQKINLKKRREEQKKILREDFDFSRAEIEHPEFERGGLDEYNAAEIKNKISQLKQQLRELQPVNMLAEKEVVEVREKVSSTRRQKQDLEQSCERLEDIIDRLNHKAREQFLEAFREIQEYFADFVTELFGGGHGKLELTEDPVLNSGVKIEVEPPGENLKTMSALSGGEKTLVAIAFQFALFEYHPTPFCFLDEVDAPFDDENVSQLINLIHRYCSETQFVMITHNKITMQAASQLYGITMEESGVSTVVALDLPEAESWREEAVG